jgi:hypothetical protein
MLRKINYRSGKELNKLENKGNKSREDAWVNKENVIERKSVACHLDQIYSLQLYLISL